MFQICMAEREKIPNIYDTAPACITSHVDCSVIVMILVGETKSKMNT